MHKRNNSNCDSLTCLWGLEFESRQKETLHLGDEFDNKSWYRRHWDVKISLPSLCSLGGLANSSLEPLSLPNSSFPIRRYPHFYTLLSLVPYLRKEVVYITTWPFIGTLSCPPPDLTCERLLEFCFMVYHDLVGEKCKNYLIGRDIFWLKVLQDLKSWERCIYDRRCRCVVTTAAAAAAFCSPYYYVWVKAMWAESTLARPSCANVAACRRRRSLRARTFVLYKRSSSHDHRHSPS